ncbi:MAG: hypothetical protein LBC61_05990 [Candidatus Peribacteria bacterium]|jgi:hypothetical protein|nr:hypothetical protein [Candidatus Peribacteria bacterium]
MISRSSLFNVSKLPSVQFKLRTQPVLVNITQELVASITKTEPVIVSVSSNVESIKSGVVNVHVSDISPWYQS